MTTPADEAVKFALDQRGKPYVWGAVGPNAFDCSGLTWAAYKHAGIEIGRTTYQQMTHGQDITIDIKTGRKKLQAGDLIFPTAAHVIMYVGGNLAVESPHTGDHVKTITPYGMGTGHIRRYVQINDPGQQTFWDDVSNWMNKNITLGGVSFAPAIDAVTNNDLMGTLTSITSALDGIGKAIDWVSDPAHLLRFAMMVSGVVLILISLHAWEKAATAVSSAANVAKNVKVS
jgi:hypothetical protein